MTPDEEYIQEIQKMGLLEWIDEMLISGDYLADPYYRHFGQALVQRGQELRVALKTYEDKLAEMGLA